jgi:hypothetical protein
MAVGDLKPNLGLYGWETYAWSRAGVGQENANVGAMTSSLVTATTARLSVQVANFGAAVRVVYGKRGSGTFESVTPVQQNNTPGTTFVFDLKGLVPASQYWAYAVAMLTTLSPRGGDTVGQPINGPTMTFTTS